MLNKHEILEHLCHCKIVTVIRAKTRNEAFHTAEACIEGGIVCVEIPFTVPEAHLVIADLKEKYPDPTVLVGAGTVLDAETARIALLSGADFIVSPSLDTETVKLCNRYGAVIIPGAMTPTEVEAALESGVDLIKVFPIDVLGIDYIHALKGPYPQARFMVTGNVELSQLEKCFKLGVSVVGVGGVITSPAKTGDYVGVRKAAADVIATLNTLQII